ncbi:MAG: hypothetical protein IGS38_06225 [Synechococcales cyanobacterium M58_A2018_015]|nr:hypothetical protein [Synechococcales cyanobacterium M58_A2018_015]
MSWQYVDQQENRGLVRDINNSATYFFELSGSEGSLRVNYLIWKSPVGADQFFCRVQFTGFDVRDDEEIGSGDWRVITRVNRLMCFNSPEERWSIGTGSSARLNAFRDFTLGSNDELVVFCRVEEEDS